MKKLFITAFILYSFSLFAQKEANIWYFGYNAGLDFNSGVPVSLTNGAMFTTEGCATISDANGSLLFYTDGTTVYNKNHQVMPNGMGLLGNGSSTQSAIIVKKPGSATIYYIFAVDGFTGMSGGLSYSEVDMTLDGGLGDINANKNIMMLAATAEKVAAVPHANGQDFWILSLEENSNTYHAYHLSSAGVNLTSVVSNIGTVYNQTLGYLRSNVTGDRIAAVVTDGFSFKDLNLYDFNKSTGSLSNLLFIDLASLDSLANWAYGVEFSPNERYLYTSLGTDVYQFDLQAGSAVDIYNSAVSLINSTASSWSAPTPWAIQLGPDEKLYVAMGSQPYLGVINQPNLPGLACDMDTMGMMLDPVMGGTSALGLPTFVNSYVISTSLTINAQHFCLGDTTIFSLEESPDSVHWTFGDPSTGGLNVSTDSMPIHVFSDTGQYTVQAIAEFSGIFDTAYFTVNITAPLFDLGNDTAICGEESLWLDATYSPTANYLWQDGTTNAQLLVEEAGLYTVEVEVDGCRHKEIILVSNPLLSTAHISGEGGTCHEKIYDKALVELEGESPFTIVYTDGVLTETAYSHDDFYIDIHAIGDYSLLSVKDVHGCQGVVSGLASYVKFDQPNANFTVNPDRVFLDSATISFTNYSNADSLIWFFGDANKPIYTSGDTTHVYTEPGQFKAHLVAVNENGCKDTAFQLLDVLPLPFYLPNAFTPEGDLLNETFGIRSDKVKDYQMMIFNRWGAKIYSTTDVNKPWDGTYKGKKVPQGVYTYHITLRDVTHQFHQFTGEVSLIR